MADVLSAAVAWRAARMRACEAPLGDSSVWRDLGAAETALSEAVRAHGVAATLDLTEDEARAVVRGACRAVAASPLANPVKPLGGVLRDLAQAIDDMHVEIEGGMQ